MHVFDRANVISIINIEYTLLVYDNYYTMLTQSRVRLNLHTIRNIRHCKIVCR